MDIFWTGTIEILFYTLLTLSTCYTTLVPEVFLDFSSRKRSRASRKAATTSCESDEERERKPLVTLTPNLTFMQTTAVKRVKLLIKRVNNGNLANTCLSAAIFLIGGRPGEIML